MTDDDDVPAIDTSRAHPARVYDYFLGGKDNFAADREAGDRALKAVRTGAQAAWDNRRFLSRAVRYVAERGIDQFLDIGAGIPTTTPDVPNVHETAKAVNPAARVVYMDNDPIVIAHNTVFRSDSGNGSGCA